MRPARTCAVLALLLSACGGGSDGTSPGPPSAGPSPPVTPAPTTPPETADIAILFMGNSHTSANALPTMVADMVRAGRPGQTVASVEAPGWLYLDARLSDAPTLALMRRQNWRFMVFQAQKYSLSGVTYSTEEAKALVRISREQQAVPVMFPEWPRRGVDETKLVYDLHVSIAQAEPACVAPIGQAWELARVRHPGLQLHADDGNHAAPAGSFLAALVLYATITGNSPLTLPRFPQYPLSGEVQDTLRGIAAETVQTVPPRMWCPGDQA